MTMEYLGEPPRRGSVVGRLVPIVVAVFAAVAVVAWWGSERVQQSARDTVSQQSLEAQQTAVAGEARVLSTLAYASPMIWSSMVTEDVRAGLRHLVQDSASAVARDLVAQRETVANTRVLPWLEDAAAAKASALAQIDEYVRRFQAVGADARAISVQFASPLSTTPSESAN